MKFNTIIATLAATLVIFVIAASLQGAYVTPKIGGGQVSAPMIMPEIFF